MNFSVSYAHLYILHLQRVDQTCIIKETLTFPMCMIFLDNAIAALVFISVKKNSTVPWNSSIDTCKHFLNHSGFIELSSDCGILQDPLNF